MEKRKNRMWELLALIMARMKGRKNMAGLIMSLLSPPLI
jgi:hypothetical protein